MNKNMKAVVLDSGEVSYDQNIILEEQTRFFETLYTTHKQSKFKLDKKSYNPELTPEMRMHCEKELSVHEIYDAVMTMEANKVWILRARDRDRDILTRLRLGHQRPVNRGCPIVRFRGSLWQVGQVTQPFPEIGQWPY